MGRFEVYQGSELCPKTWTRSLELRSMPRPRSSWLTSITDYVQVFTSCTGGIWTDACQTEFGRVLGPPQIGTHFCSEFSNKKLCISLDIVGSSKIAKCRSDEEKCSSFGGALLIRSLDVYS